MYWIIWRKLIPTFNLRLNLTHWCNAINTIKTFGKLRRKSLHLGFNQEVSDIKKKIKWKRERKSKEYLKPEDCSKAALLRVLADCTHILTSKAKASSSGSRLSCVPRTYYLRKYFFGKVFPVLINPFGVSGDFYI